MSHDDDDGTCQFAERRSDRFIDRLFRTEAPRLARFIRRSIKQPDDVHDLVQETFVNFVAGAPKSSVRNPEAYLTTIARRLLWGRAKRREAQGNVQHVSVDDADELSIGPEQEWMMEASDVIRRYEQALAELPARTREVFRLSRQEDLSYEEIAERLGITKRMVKYHLRKALMYLDRRVNGND